MASGYEAQGMYLQAADTYKEVLYKNATLLQYREALRRNAQKVIDEKMSSFFVDFNKDNIPSAVKIFDEAEYYATQLRYFNIELLIPETYREDYKKGIDMHMASLYSEGKELSADGNFTEARSKFETISKYNPDYKDVKLLLEESGIEPSYARAVEAFNNKSYYKSWELFEKVAQSNPEYKQTQDFCDKIREKLAITIAILPSHTQLYFLENRLRFNIISSISQLNNPFLQIVDRENLEILIEEQKLGLSGLIDEKTAASLGRISGAKFVLLPKVISHNFIKGNLFRQELVAYEGSQTAVKDPVTGAVNYPTEYRPVKYLDFTQENKLQFSFQYQLISTENGIIATSDIIHEEVTDNVHYAHYPGNYTLLYPAYNNNIYKSGPERDEFLILFNSGKDPATRHELEFTAQKKIGLKVAESLDTYLKNQR